MAQRTGCETQRLTESDLIRRLGLAMKSNAAWTAAKRADERARRAGGDEPHIYRYSLRMAFRAAVKHMERDSGT